MANTFIAKNSFMAKKIYQNILRCGQEVIFTHVGEDKYHNPIEAVNLVVTGIFHQGTAYQTKASDEGSVMSRKNSPMFLCMYKDGNVLSVGDTTNINGKDMTIIGIDNIMEQNTALNVSLEVNE